MIGAESKLNARPNIIEKDIWICWILQELFTLPISMAFKGGKSLSKVYGLINRFSEDVDVTIDYREFSPSTDLKTPISNSVLKKLSDNLKIEVKQYTQNKISPFIEERFKINFPHMEFKLELSADGEQLRLFYPTLFIKKIVIYKIMFL